MSTRECLNCSKQVHESYDDCWNCKASMETGKVSAPVVEVRNQFVNRKKFNEVVEKMTEFSVEHPQLYKARVFAMAILGYAYIFLMIGLALVVIAGFGVFVMQAHRVNGFLIAKIAIPVCVFIFLSLEALWIKITPPQGIDVTQKDAPKLFSLIHELEKKLRVPKIHKVLLTNELNACVVQRPRLGVFGFHENYLCIGTFLLQTLTPKQFEGVIGHEMGHLSMAHGRLGGWIYGVQESYVQLALAFRSKKGIGERLYGDFFEWFEPRFSGSSLVLRRQQEYDADTVAAEAVGKSQMAGALIQLAVKSELFSEASNHIYAQVRKENAPPKSLTQSLRTFLSQNLTESRVIDIVQKSLKETTQNIDSHPALTDRLNHLGTPLSLIKANRVTEMYESLDRLPELSAADSYFDKSHFLKVLETQDQIWLKKNSKKWALAHQRACQVDAQILAYEQAKEKAALSADEHYQYALLLTEREGYEAGLAEIKQLLANAPDHALANYSYGRFLLEHGDKKGIESIDIAMDKDISLVVSGCELIMDFLRSEGDEKACEPYFLRVCKTKGQLEKAKTERSVEVTHKTKFEPHGLGVEDKDKLKNFFIKWPSIEEAYLVKRKLNYFPEYPVYIFLFMTGTKLSEVEIKEMGEALGFMGEALFAVNNKKIKKAVSQTEDSLIYHAVPKVMEKL